jgi:hypothetical protein
LTILFYENRPQKNNLRARTLFYAFPNIAEVDPFTAVLFKKELLPLQHGGSLFTLMFHSMFSSNYIVLEA